MIATGHCKADRVTVAEGTLSHASIDGNMEWHGMYQDLLFRRGAVNPPCSHVRDAPPAHTLAMKKEGSVSCSEAEAAEGNCVSASQDGHMNTATVAFVQDFLSNSSKVRERGCTNIPRIFEALGNAVYEFILFLQDFEEGEDDEGVLTALCNGLRGLFETFEKGNKECGKRPSRWDAKGFSAISSLLLRVMIHRDRDLKMAALEAYTALLFSCDYTSVIQNEVIPQVLELSEDQRDTFRQAAASVLPVTLQCAYRAAEALRNGQRTHGNAQQKRCLDELVDLKQRLLAAYVRVCGDKNSTVQLAAGQQLPLFVDYVAAEVELLQQEETLEQLPLSDGVDGSATGRIGELMIAIYTAAQKFTLSPNESCRIQGVAAVAAMARRNAMAFKALGANFFPMLCSDSSWRVRAAVCLALEDLAFLFSDSASSKGVEGPGSHTDVAAAASCMPSLLFKFLTDRSPMVKIAALQLLQRTAELLGSASFVRDSWLVELHQMGDDERPNLGSRLPGACLDAVIGIIPLTSGDQRRTLLELAVDLARRGNWKLKITFLASMDCLMQDELALVSPVILNESFARDEDGDDCWRVHAAVAQQLPVILDAEVMVTQRSKVAQED